MPSGRFEREIEEVLNAQGDFPGESDGEDQQPWRWRLWLFLEDCIALFFHLLPAILLTGSGGFVLFYALSNGSNLILVIIGLGWFLYGWWKGRQDLIEFRNIMSRGRMWRG